MNNKTGEEIKKIRTSLGLDQKRFAEKLNVTNVYISNIEKGKKFPSDDLLKNIYAMVGREVPNDVIEAIKDVKIERKYSEGTLSNGIVYSLQEEGMYDYDKLKSLLQKDSGNIKYIYGMLSLLKSNNKTEEARQHLLNSLIYVKEEEYKRWLEACYFLSEKNFETALTLIKKALEVLQNSIYSNEELSRRKAGLLFETGNIYYEYGYYTYNNIYNTELALKCFKNAFYYFEEQRKIYKEPQYEMIYANVFWWIAFLGENTRENWIKYINQAENVLIINHHYAMKKSFPNKHSKGLYSNAYILQMIGSMAESYAQLAILNKENANDYLRNGELLLSQNVPIKISPEKKEYYNFYFSYSCFFSMKGSLSKKEDSELYLDLCFKGLEEAYYSDAKNKSNQMFYDLETTRNKELKFYFDMRPEDYNYFTKRGNIND